MSECEIKKCPFWEGDHCVDPQEWVDPDNGAPVCRYWDGAVLESEFNSEISGEKQ